jgi:hypothetical protein
VVNSNCEEGALMKVPGRMKRVISFVDGIHAFIKMQVASENILLVMKNGFDENQG